MCHRHTSSPLIGQSCYLTSEEVKRSKTEAGAGVAGVRAGVSGSGRGAGGLQSSPMSWQLSLSGKGSMVVEREWSNDGQILRIIYIQTTCAQLIGWQLLKPKACLATQMC